MRRFWTVPEIARLRAAVSSGATLKEIAPKFGRTYAAVRKFAAHAGITRRMPR